MTFEPVRVSVQRSGGPPATLRRLAGVEIEWIDEQSANLARDGSPKYVKEGGWKALLISDIFLESPCIKLDNTLCYNNVKIPKQG